MDPNQNCTALSNGNTSWQISISTRPTGEATYTATSSEMRWLLGRTGTAESFHSKMITERSTRLRKPLLA